MTTRHTWIGPYAQLPGPELLDQLEDQDGLRLVTVVPVPMPVGVDEASGQQIITQGYLVLMRRETRLVVAAPVPHRH